MSMKKCLECGAEISDQAPQCPKCGFIQKIASERAWVFPIVSIALILAVGAAAWGYKAHQDYKDRAAYAEYMQNKYTVETPANQSILLSQINDVSQDVTGVLHATGEVRNTTDDTFSYVEIQVEFYDASNNQVGMDYQNTGHLGPHETWKFETMGEDGAVRVEIIRVKATRDL